MSQPEPEFLVELKQRLFPYDESASRLVEGDDWQTLLWHVGDIRRQLDDAHQILDLSDAPRKNGVARYTVRGRIEQLVIQHKAQEYQRSVDERRRFEQSKDYRGG